MSSAVPRAVVEAFYHALSICDIDLRCYDAVEQILGYSLDAYDGYGVEENIVTI